MIAAFLGLRLYSVLGRRAEHEEEIDPDPLRSARQPAGTQRLRRRSRRSCSRHRSASLAGFPAGDRARAARDRRGRSPVRPSDLPRRRQGRLRHDSRSVLARRQGRAARTVRRRCLCTASPPPSTRARAKPARRSTTGWSGSRTRPSIRRALDGQIARIAVRFRRRYRRGHPRQGRQRDRRLARRRGRKPRHLDVLPRRQRPPRPTGCSTKPTTADAALRGLMAGTRWPDRTVRRCARRHGSARQLRRPRPSGRPRRAFANPAPAPPQSRCSPASGRPVDRARSALLPTTPARALDAFAESCPALLRREDVSGLTRRARLAGGLPRRRRWPRGRGGALLRHLFRDRRRSATAAAFATGYFEPADRRRAHALLRLRRAGLRRAGRPRARLARGYAARASATGRPPLGRYRRRRASSSPITTAPQIEDGALAGRGLEIAWAADPVEFFFLQVQGSGRLRGPDGSMMRIGYAGQNGRAYTRRSAASCASAGCWATGPGNMPASCRASCSTLREHPEEGRALMRENQSWVFFREMVGDGPLGALGVPVRRAELGRGRSPIRAARRAGLARYGPVRTPPGCGSRRTPAGRSRAPTASTPSGARARTRAASPAG